MNLVILGLILDIMGVSILVFVTIWSPWHQRIFREKKRWKRYYWSSWRPLYKNTKTLKWKIKWSRKILVYGVIPPTYQLNIIGFLCILLGFILQLIFFL